MKSSTRERGIVFSGPMVRAILDGQKTQTRRVVKNTTDRTVSVRWHKGEVFPGPGIYEGWVREQSGLMLLLPTRCPFGAVGDRLWLRETTWFREKDGITWYDDKQFRLHHTCMLGAKLYTPAKEMEAISHLEWKSFGFKRRSSIHMPRWASRITLEITGVRVERVQDISDDDVVAEGVIHDRGDGETWYDGKHQHIYAEAWDKINGKKHSWESNPWVWVISFRRLEAEGGK